MAEDRSWNPNRYFVAYIFLNANTIYKFYIFFRIKRFERPKRAADARASEHIRSDLFDGELLTEDVDKRCQGDSLVLLTQYMCRSNMEVLSNTISKCLEANEIGDATIGQLSLQREQLLRVDDDLHTINQTLSRCERQITNLSGIRGSISNLFTRKKADCDEKDNRFKFTNKSEERVLGIPPEINDASDCARKGIRKLIEEKETALGFKIGQERLIFHFCNTRNPTLSNPLSKCILITNRRLLRIVVLTFMLALWEDCHLS